MAHQCLKCGHSYPDGSPQILKGCEQCKGTRFFYTDEPLDDAARAVVADRTEADLERLALGKSAEEASETKPARRIPTKDELPLGSDKDWVELGPNYLRNVVEEVVKRAHEKKPVFRVGNAPTDSDKPTLAEWIRDNGGELPDETAERSSRAPRTRGREPVGREAQELLDDLVAPEREARWREDARGDQVTRGDSDRSAPSDPSAVDPGAGEEDVVYKRGPRPVPKPVSLAGVPVKASEDDELRRKARERVEEAAIPDEPEVPEEPAEGESLYPEGQRPETVGVSAPGVYELDVKRLMEHNPIVVHKDGTYNLHLPSLMDSVDKKRKRVRRKA